MHPLEPFVPIDRLQALAHGVPLPDRTHGAALFADITGFTPLTHALVVNHGYRTGAEKLTRKLNTVYEALVNVVHHFGGSVIGFSGDAITCWFDGDDGWLATTCALDMQNVMKQFASSSTDASTNEPLTIKIAIAAGPAQRFVVGDPEIQIMDALAGQTLVNMAVAEKHAGKNEVIITPEIKERIGSKVQTTEKRFVETQAVFYVVTELNAAAPARPWSSLPASILTEAQLRPWLLRPVYTRLQNDPEQSLAESRTAVALFLQFGKIDYDNDASAGLKLDAYIRWVQRILEQHDGHLVQLTIGDKDSYLYATFGALVAHDDDAQRAIAAALQLVSPPVYLSPLLKAQIGISQGRVFVGIYGSTERHALGVLGDEVNLAARLMTGSEPGQITVSQRIFQSAIGSYHFKHLGLVKIKGKEALQEVYQVTDEQTTDAIAGNLSPVVGRDRELNLCEQLLAALYAGEGHVLRISGAAGIGKSRLKAVLLEKAAAEHMTIAQGVCHSSTQQMIFHPWRQILNTLLDQAQETADTSEVVDRATRVERIVAGMDTRWLPRLPLLNELLDLSIPDNATTRVLDARQRQALLFDLVIDMLQVWASHQPCVIVLEDVHWLDEASEQLTLAVGRALMSTPISLTVVHRTAEEEDRSVLPELRQLSNYHPVDLDSLSPEALRIIVAHRLPGEIAPLVIEVIVRRTQGNPLFIEQLVEALSSSARLYRSEGDRWTWSAAMFTALLSSGCLEKRDSEWVLAEGASLSAANLDIPDTLQALVQARLDRLRPEHQQLLKVASVIGTEFDLELLARSYPDPDRLNRDNMEEQLRFLAAHQLLQSRSTPTQLTYAFAHPSLQEATYESVTDEQRYQLHEAVGQALEGLAGDKIELLAYHFDRSRLDDKAIFYLDHAAQAARLRGLHRTALSHFTRALLRANRWEWHAGKLEAWHGLGERAEELAELQALAAMKHVPPAETARLWSDYYEATGDYPQAQAQIERALIVYRRRSEGLGEVRCLNQLGAIAARQGEFDRARDCYRQALDLLGHKADRSAEETLILIRAWNGLGIAACQQAQYDDSRTHFTQALNLSRELGNRLEEAQALNNLGMLAAYQRDFDRAQQHHREALEIRRAIGHRAGEGLSSYNLAVAHVEAGSYAEAETFFKAALSIARALGNRWDEVNVLNGMGVLYLLLGRLIQAQTYLQKGLAVAQEIGDEAGQAYALCNLGQVLRDTGDLESAEQLLIESLNLAQMHNDTRLASICFSHLSTVSLQAGQIAQAIDHAKQALALRREIDLRLSTTADLTTLASANLLAGDIIAALNCAEQAASILDAHGGEGAEFPHRDYHICYQVFFAAGQVERALAALQSACRLVTSMTDKITDSKLRESFLAIPVNREIVSEYHRHWPDATQRIGNE